jgi:hypothetical protein
MSRAGSNFDRIAGAHITAAGVNTVADGCVGANTGAGTFTVTLDNPCAVADRVVIVALANNGIVAFCESVDTSATVIGVRTFNLAGAAASYEFDIVVYRRT